MRRYLHALTIDTYGPQDFSDLLNFMFRKRRGRWYVEQGHYDLTVDKRLADRKQWSEMIKPGVTVTMDIRLLSDVENVADRRKCPACRHLCVDAGLGDEVTWRVIGLLSMV